MSTNCILATLYRHSQQLANKTAMRDEYGQTLSYQALWLSSAPFAHFKATDVIAITGRKDIWQIVAMLAVWRSGSTFLLIPEDLPQSRRQQLLSLTTYELQSAVLKPRIDHLPTTALDFARPHCGYWVCSSGSTGEPKIIQGSYLGLSHVIAQQIQLFKLSPADNCVWALWPGFDASLSDIFVSLCAGACLFVLDHRHLATPEQFFSTLEQNAISYADLPPALLEHSMHLQAPASLRTIVTGGEVTSLQALQHWASRVTVFNVYGPSEASVCCTALNVNEALASSALIEGDIGRPLDGVELQLSDSNELKIGGSTLGIGYLDSKLTAARFTTDATGKRWYNSGDQVLNENGRWIFKGRTDRQIKLGGRLLCPEEVETLLAQVAGVKEVVVALTQGQLTAYLVRTASATNNDLSAHCCKRLPSWMVPSRWITVVSPFPRLDNGKIDYKKISVQPTKAPASWQPKTVEEKAITQAWRDALPNSHPRPDSHFFDDGGDSLAVLTLISSCRKLGIAIDAETVYKTPQLKELVKAAGITVHKRCISELKLDVDKLVLQLPQPTPASSGPKRSGVLVTGATGFLGIHLVEALLARGTAVTCLVRAGNGISPQRRLAQVANQFHCKLNWSVINVIAGDIELPYCGVDLATLGNINTVIHCAAAVSVCDGFQAMRNSNLIGCWNTLMMTKAIGAKFIQASTLSTQIMGDYRGEITESLSLMANTWLGGSYAQTKWQAEYLLSIAGPATVIRYGLLCPHQRRGIFPKQDWLAAFIRAAANAPHRMTLVEGKFDCTPVDIAVEKTMAIIDKSIAAEAATYVTIRGETMSKQALINTAEKFANKKRPLSNIEEATVNLAMNAPAYDAHTLFPIDGVQLNTSNSDQLFDLPSRPLRDDILPFYVKSALNQYV